MPMVLLDLDGAEQRLLGMIARRLLEVRPGVYVGAASRRSIEEMWALVEASKPTAAMLIYPARNELGIAIRSLGNHRYSVIDHFGIQLIQYQRSIR